MSTFTCHNLQHESPALLHKRYTSQKEHGNLRRQYQPVPSIELNFLPSLKELPQNQYAMLDCTAM